MNAQIFLAEAAPSVDTEFNFSQMGTHPAGGLVRAYVLRVTGNVSSSNVAGTATTYANWRDTLLGGLFTLMQLFAPRYSAQLCSANTDGNFWAKQYEDKYNRPLPLLINGVQVETDASVSVPNAATPYEVDLVIPFELPKLGPDRLWPCPPASLFRGDVSLKFKWHASKALGGDTITITVANARMLVVTAYGDDARVPITHRFERRVYSTSSNDIGRGFVFYLDDSNAPNDTNTYNVFLDGVSINNGAIKALDFVAVQRIENADAQPEQRVYTQLGWLADNVTVSQLVFAQQSLAVQQTGVTSGIYDIHMADPASGGTVQQNLAQALGIPPGVETHALPATPAAAPMGTVRRDIALAGPRTLSIGGKAPRQAAKTVPTVPHGTAGASVGRAMLGGGRK